MNVKSEKDTQLSDWMESEYNWALAEKTEQSPSVILVWVCLVCTPSLIELSSPPGSSTRNQYQFAEAGVEFQQYYLS